jgi:hypothetical protein
MYDFDTGPTSSARDFVARELRAEPDVTYPEVRDRAARVGLNVPPFLYGAARRSLGLPPRPTPLAGEPDQATALTQPGHGVGSADLGGTPAGETTHDKFMTEDGADQDPPANGASANGARTNGAPANGAPANGPAADAAPMRKRGGSTAFEFAVEMLKLSPDISFQDLRDRAVLAGLKMPPIIYGRAKALLGLVPTKPRRKREAPPAPRVLRQVDSAAMLQPQPNMAGVRQIEQLVQTVRDLEAQCRKLRAAVEATLMITAAALDDDAAAKTDAN